MPSATPQPASTIHGLMLELRTEVNRYERQNFGSSNAAPPALEEVCDALRTAIRKLREDRPR